MGPLHILEATFRAGPGFELVQFERLPALEQRALGDLRNDPDGFGVLRPQAPGHDLKAVCWRTALLWHTLQSPGPLPARLLDADASQANAAVVRLVLDHILEIETPEGFVGGAAAWPLLGVPAAETAPQGVLAQLSETAVRYGHSLRLTDPLRLSARLYDFHRLPVTPAAVDRLDAAAGASALWRPTLGTAWLESGSAYWRVWSRRSAGPARLKLYISPRPDALIAAFDGLIAVLKHAPIVAFKVGADVANLLRPDKCVVYLPDRPALQDLVAALSPLTDALPAHGVPFTAEAEPSGVLSWGADPPGDPARLPWQGPSWRRWITDRLAVSLCANPDAPVPSWRFALERLRLDGVDPDTWAPLALPEGADG